MELRHQESRKRGHVEDHLCLDIRRLLKEEIIVKGRTTSWVGYWGFLITIDANLEQADNLIIRLSFQTKQQALRCQYGTDKLKRTRLFFVDDMGGNVEKIYLVGDRFVSRRVGCLAFRDQSKTKVGPRTLRHRVQWPLERQLQSSLPDQKRSSVENELAQVKRKLDFLLLGKVAMRLEQRWRRREQRKHFRRRFRTAQLKMKQRITVTPEQILADYTKLVEDVAEITTRITTSSSFILPPQDANQARNIDDIPHIDTCLLTKMGLIREGEISSCQLGWPIKWLPQRRRRLYLIVDCRNSEKPYAAVISHTVKKARAHLFWLSKASGRFGRKQYKFECPYTGQTSPVLIYENGKFRPLPSFSYETTDDVVRRLIRLQLRERIDSHDEEHQPSAERVTLLKMVVADKARLRQWRRDSLELANELMFDDTHLPQSAYPQIPIRTD